MINNFSEPQDTPEHNKLQAEFLNPSCCAALLKRLNVESICEISPAQFELNAIDVYFTYTYPRYYKNLEGQIEQYMDEKGVSIEIKPTLSDDYPSILRNGIGTPKGGSLGHKVLIVGDFSSDAIDFDQLKAIFASRGILVIKFSELDIEERPG